MKCQNVLNQLSPFLDEALRDDKATRISEHLESCAGCSREFDHLKLLRRKLASLGTVTPPDYLHHMLQLRLGNAARNAWSSHIRDAWEYRWSRIRTTEGVWFFTRVLGTTMTLIFFLAISSGMNPIYMDMELQPRIPERGSLSQILRQQLGVNVLKNLGLTPVEAQRKPISPSDPMINDLYLLNFGQNSMRAVSDDTLSVVTLVDRSGTATIQNVLEYPAERSLLSDLDNMLTSARCRPARQNGRAIDSHLVLSFSKISVYD